MRSHFLFQDIVSVYLFLFVSGNYFRMPAGATSTPTSAERRDCIRDETRRARFVDEALTIASLALSPFGTMIACSTP